MKTKYIFIILTLFLFYFCKKENTVSENNSQNETKISTARRILSKLNLIDLDEGLIQREKMKEAYDLLKIIELNKKSIDTVAKNQIFKIFNNDSLAKDFISKEVKFINNGYKIDSINLDLDTINVVLKNKENKLRRKFIYKMVNDSIINKNLPPTVFFNILNAQYFESVVDTISIDK